MAARIFINYRHSDEAGFALALYGRLKETFAADDLFMDVAGGIAVGDDFVRVLEERIRACEVLIVVIGQGWLAADDTGHRPIDDPRNFVRIEIEGAMRLAKRIIPVLINNTKMPAANMLPMSMRSFVNTQAFQLSQGRWESDTAALAETIENALERAKLIRGASDIAHLPKRTLKQGNIGLTMLGACVFGAGEGLGTHGLGCLSRPSQDLLRAVDMRGANRIEPNELFWFSLPTRVGDSASLLLGQVSFARDCRHRDGIAGAAVLMAMEQIDKAGFAGAAFAVEHLHQRVVQFCLNASTAEFTFENTPDILSLIMPIDNQQDVRFTNQEPIKIHLTRTWAQYICLPELFRVISNDPDLGKGASACGYILRDGTNSPHDIEIAEDFLDSWYSRLYGEHPMECARPTRR